MLKRTAKQMNSKNIALGDIPSLLSANDSYIIVCHRKPDGDTLGSAYALLRILELKGASGRIVCADQMPSYLQKVFDYGVNDDAAVRRGEKVITVDVAETSLFGRIYEEVSKKGIYLKIDHHLTGESYAEYNYVDSEASSVGEIIFSLAELMGFEGDFELCRSAFVAMSTDTGGFKYSNTRSQTYMAAAKISSVCGEELVGINTLLFETKPLSKVIANAVAVDYMRLACDDRVAYAVFDDEMKLEEGITDDDLDEAVALFRQIEGVVAAFLVRQIGDKKYRISARSKAGFDCSAFCTEFDGGGHMFAAGCNINAGSAEEAEDILLQAVPRYFYEC